MEIPILIFDFILQIISDESTSESSSEVQNSATEISTDSEFAHDDPTPTRELPFITLNDVHVTKTRGSGGNCPKKIQVKSGYLQKPSKEKPNIDLKLEPIVPPALLIKKPAPVLLPRTEGYTLNRTQSTGGIAAKVSLELKKKYLLGEATSGSIQKSGSASTLETKLKSFQTTISDCQKLLKPGNEISASMQTFCNKLNERNSPVLSPHSSIKFDKNILLKNDQRNPNIPDIIENKEIVSSVDSGKNDVFENESEGRPRSPAYETSIIVPKIDWNKNNQSLSSDSLATSESENEFHFKQFENIPRVEVHQPKEEIKDEMTLDSLCVIDDETLNQNRKDLSNETEVAKSITSEKKSLNQPKALPNLKNMLPKIHNSLHVKCETSEADKITEALHNSSGLSTPESVIDQPTIALTETELSDWARDDVVSEDFEDVYERTQFHSNPLNKKSESPEIVQLKEPQNVISICKHSEEIRGKTINLDGIEFMDTGTETSSEDGNIDSQEGYVLLKNDDEITGEVSQHINETIDVYVSKANPLNTGYCFISTDSTERSSEILKISNDSIKQNVSVGNDVEEDSLQVTGTTTEENTFSDSTVKNVTEILIDKQKGLEQSASNNNNTQSVIEKNIPENECFNKESAIKENKFLLKEDNIEFDEHCQRLQSRVEFSNARDSIDIRKSRRKSKSELPHKPDLIQEEKTDNSKEIVLNLSPTPHTPDILYNKEIIKKERDVNQKLIQEMVMNKMKAENKSLERKKRNRLSACSLSPKPLSKAKTTDSSSKISEATINKLAHSKSSVSTPDVLLTTSNIPLENSKSMHTVNFSNIKNGGSLNETPKPPPRLLRQNEDIYRKLKKLEKSVLPKQNNINDENSIVKTTQKRLSWQSPNDLKKSSRAFVRSLSVESQITATTVSLTKAQQGRCSVIKTTSIPDVKSTSKEEHSQNFICKSDPNMLQIDNKSVKKSKDRERRKSITKLFATFFTKKSFNTNGTKGLFSKMSPQSKPLSKVGITKLIHNIVNMSI